MSTSRFIVGITLLAILGLSFPVAAQVAGPVTTALNLAPADAQMLVVVNDLSRVSDRIAVLREELDLSYPDLDDALGAFKRKTGMLDGVNDSGVMLLSINGLERIEAQDASPRVLVLMPVSDYAGFVGQYGGDGTAEIAELRLANGAQGYAKSLESYAVFGGDREAIAGYEPADAAAALTDQLEAHGRAAVGDADIAALVDLTKTADANPALVEAGLRLAGNTLAALVAPSASPTQDASQPAPALRNDDDGSAALVQFGSLFTRLADNAMLRDGLAAMMKDSRAMVVAGELGRGDTAVTLAFHVNPDTPTAALFRPSTDSAGKVLAALPDRPYLFATAVDGQGMDLPGLLKLIVGEQGDPGPILRLKAEAGPLAEQVNAAAAAVFTPGDNAVYSGSLLNAVAVYRVKDGSKFLEGLKTYFHDLNKIEPGADGTTYQGDYMQNALRLADDVSVDQFKLNPVIPPATMREMPLTTQALITSVFPMNGYVAAKGNDVVLVTSLDTQQITRALEAIEQQAGLGSAAAIAGRRERTLPAGSVMETYVDVSGVAGLADLVLPALGLPGLPPAGDLSPLSLGIGVEGESVAFRLDLPDETMRYLLRSTILLNEQLDPGGPARSDDPFAY